MADEPARHRDFAEIGHSGGIVSFNIRRDSDGNPSLQLGFSDKSLGPMTLVGLYAHPDGFACGMIQLGGIGVPWNAPPLPNCLPVLLASDSEGKFGHDCPRCTRHFRSNGIPSHHALICPYCGLRSSGHRFLSSAQRAYVDHYIRTLTEAIDRVAPSSETVVEIDMNEIADSVDGVRSEFYYASVRQQTIFICSSCESFNDVQGRYAYCASCGSRNNADVFRTAMKALRDKLNAGHITPEDSVRTAVSEFDACCRNFVETLASLVPMTPRRRNMVKDLLFHNIERAPEAVKEVFDIDMLQEMDRERPFLKMMFERRHVYEHDGGVATDLYVEKSDDRTVVKGVLIRESTSNAHKLISLLDRMVVRVQDSFPYFYKLEDVPIEYATKRRAR